MKGEFRQDFAEYLRGLRKLYPENNLMVKIMGKNYLREIIETELNLQKDEE